jgi:hypothetical protein
MNGLSKFMKLTKAATFYSGTVVVLSVHRLVGFHYSDYGACPKHFCVDNSPSYLEKYL